MTGKINKEMAKTASDIEMTNGVMYSPRVLGLRISAATTRKFRIDPPILSKVNNIAPVTDCASEKSECTVLPSLVWI